MPTLIINFANSCNTFKVSEKDCVADIKSFYRALAMKYHPLLNPPGSSAKSQVKTIDVACETLPTKLDSSKVCGSEVVTKQRKSKKSKPKCTAFLLMPY